MRAAVALVLVLCAALTLRVRPEHPRLSEHPHSDQGRSHCNEHSPSIRVYMNNWQLTNENESFIPYGELMRVTCLGTGDAALAMTKNGQKLQTKTTIFGIEWHERKPDLLTSRFVCTDVRTGCQRSMVVSVTPSVVVSATNLDGFYNNYTVQYGDAMSVSCSGPDATRLVLTKDGDTLRTEQKDEHTVMWSTKKTDLQISEYVCSDLNTTSNRSILVRVVPKIYIRLQSQNEKETPEDDSGAHMLIYEYAFTYGEVIEIVCSGPSGVNLINLDDNQELSHNITGTTVKSLVEIYKETVFGCVNSDYPDNKGTVKVLVRPRMEVSSPSIQFEESLGWYIIKYGDPLQIICSGPDAGELEIFKKDRGTSIKEQSSIVSNTTIMWSVKKELFTAIFDPVYYCRIKERMGSEVRILVLPEAIGFHCVSRNLDSLNCSWTAPSRRTNFTLYHVENGHPVWICTRVEHSQYGIFHADKARNQGKVYSTSRFCVWYNTDSPGYPDHVPTLSFLMQSCDYFGCFNQSFLIDHLSIVKPEPPQGLKIIRTSSSGAMLGWTLSLLTSFGNRLMSGNEFIYKVEYEQLGKEPLEANSSLVTCRKQQIATICIIQLTLPCPGQYYTVRVYQRLKETVEEEFWSDPSTVNFNTDFKYKPENFYTCNSEPINSPEVMIHFNRQFKVEVHQDINQMKKKIELLQKKMALIRTYLDNN